MSTNLPLCGFTDGTRYMLTKFLLKIADLKPAFPSLPPCPFPGGSCLSLMAFSAKIQLLWRTFPPLVRHSPVGPTLLVVCVLPPELVEW